MTEFDIVNALQMLTPGAQWSLNGNTLDGLVWIDKVQVQPTNQAILAAIAAYVPPLALEQRVTQLETSMKTLVPTFTP
jgi:hypothetical protein